MIQQAIARLLERQDLSEDEAFAALGEIMRGEATPAQIGGFLVALRMKGETVAEIAGCARAMRASAIPVYSRRFGPDELVDTCGTGGDHAGTFNISTTAAFVVAGAGVPVAKHGNRSITSRSGSADVLNALGVNLDLTPEQVAVCLDEANIAFLFAVKHHPAMRFAIGPRRELAARTVFNLLGPLTNPAGAKRQVIGVYDPALTADMAGVLGRLGSRAAFVVHALTPDGRPGLDELSTTGVNRVSQLHPDGHVSTFDLDTRELGLAPATLDDLRGGDAAANAMITRGILDGSQRGAPRDVVLLNAAAMLATLSGDWASGLTRARASLDSGAALACLEKLIATSQAAG
ncbi:MAG: anthranilate phosphoribosyltransferase [Anaerolineae bacterium]|uniref:anthranilate phosphoribosyltransferase n=1 Tax=Candidatus Amarolinea dominans TaxID=3140696 RepID=UPI001DA66FA2|nr:anthranilate phosphoribosyltransferase [Anaerolineae bacterium]MBK7201728.1 anthranilate phosphoribosyltransferase [Anaerolineae bacterium]MBK9096179.1 anthranilate phosphoribosyltransferase [Anaerolineae bacterium]MBK9230981.1 anthranilate phosphoribosyltransferase [Anaerolineae bacterium]